MKKLILMSFVILLTPIASSAHTRLKASVGVQPRSTNAGIKSGPCGVAKAASAPTLNAGDPLTVTFEETINHNGYFELRFSTDGDVTWSAPVTVPDNATGMTPHPFSTVVTLPNVTCDNCTLQLIQVMLDQQGNASNYYSCADFKLVRSGAPVPTPPPAVSPTPIPGLDSDCDMSH